jgi:large subunit ribosomal protein L22
MVKTKYQAKVGRESRTAKATLKNANVSLKSATELFREIKGQPVDKAIKKIQRIAAKEEALPLRKYNKKVAHRKGDAKSGVKSGRYPVKTAKKFAELLELAKSNADFKGLDTERLLVLHGHASMGFSRQTTQPKGRIGGKVRQRKSAHLEVIVTEVKG